MNDVITRNIEEIQTGFQAFRDIGAIDFIYLIIIACVIIVGMWIVMKIAGTLLKLVVVAAMAVAVGFMMFGFDPMGLGTLLTNYIDQFHW